MAELAILIGGKAGDGIKQSGVLISRLLGQLGYQSYMYFDYPSVIRGAHNFAIIRASSHKVEAHSDEVDCILALNQDTVEKHRYRLKDEGTIIFDSSKVDAEGMGIDLKEILKDKEVKPIMVNSCLVGALAKLLGISWEIVQKTFEKFMSKETEANIELAEEGFQALEAAKQLGKVGDNKLPIISGNEAVAMGLIRGGLDAYVSYPMTPSSGVLHFLAKEAPKVGMKVIHPENEISVILTALGMAYAGHKAAVGTAGGGFCLMNEGFSLAAASETPLVVVVSQRPAPATGVPTYTSQGDLEFVLHAGHGEFLRLVVAPGDLNQAFYWSEAALKLSWKYQLPAIVLTDKTLSESYGSFDLEEVEEAPDYEPLLWQGDNDYERYRISDDGISPMAFPGREGAVVKATSYEHDSKGIATEAPQEIEAMQDKRFSKQSDLEADLGKLPAVETYGNLQSSTALLCWGSNKGICQEVAQRLDIKVVQPVVLAPFPADQLNEALEGVDNIIAVECNKTGQLCKLVKSCGKEVSSKILKYDGRPFSKEELYDKVARVL
ncbi:MAG: 2-oxoacid:acceptor oxidoreductase subunit alpha [Chlamydiota bacterium]